MNFISELTPHFVPLSALLISLILTPVNFSGGGGEGIEGMEGGDGGGKDGEGGGGMKRGMRNDSEIRGEVGEGRGMGGGEQTGLLQRAETVGVLDGGRGESEGGTTEGVNDLERRRLEKMGVTVAATEGDGGGLGEGDGGGMSKGENGSGGGGGAKDGGTRVEHESEEVEKVVEERVGGIDERGEVGEGRVETGGMGEEGWAERRIREIGEIGEAGKIEAEIGSEDGERREEEEGRTSRSSLPFGLHRNNPDNVCLQARHFSDQQLQSPEGQRRANNNDTMMTTMMTTTTMATMMRSVEEEILAHSNRFVININATKYIPGHTLTVTVSSPIPYRGFLLQARRYRSPVVVGSFTNPSSSSEPASNETDDDIIFFNCDGLSDTILAWLPRAVANLSTVWLPSNEDVGLIQFVATIFVTEIDFRSNVTSKVFRKGFRRIDLEGCGKLKGCFRYLNEGSDTCDADTCQYLVTYQVLDTEAQFELSAVADWVSIAFSSDERMGGDDVFMCVRNRWTVDVRRYVTEVGYQTPIEKDMSPLYDVQGEVGEDDRVSCRFRRPLKVTHDSEDQFSIDLNNNWFQLYAWGPISASGGITRHSLDRPPTSQTKLSLRPTRNEFMTGSGSQPVRPPLLTIILLLLILSTTTTATAAILQLLLPSHQHL